jgi:hypothetical protein
MKATVNTAFAVVLAVTLGVAATQASQTPQTVQPAQSTPTTQKQVPPEVTLTGCIVQGSSPTVFILDNAKKDPSNATEKGERYLLEKASEDVDIRTQLNHQVRIVGEVDAKVSADPVTAPPVPPVPPPPTDPEKSLSKLTVKSLTMVSDTCATVR